MILKFKKLSKAELYFLAMILTMTLLGLIIELSDDEAYYWSWSLKPALSYFDHPPLQAWTTALSTSLFGKNNFAVRLPAILFLIFSGWLLLKLAKKNKVEDSALWICLNSPIFYIFSWIILPDICFLPLALLSLYLAESKKYFRSGISGGFALLAKWHALLLIPAVCFSIVFKEKESFRSKIKNIFSYLIPTCVLQIPVLIWNAQYNWEPFYYHFVKRHGRHSHKILDLLKNGFSFFTVFLLLMGFGFIYLAFQYFKTSLKKGKFSFQRSDLFLLAYAVPFIGIFGLSAINGETRVYWTCFAVYPLSIFLLKHATQKQREAFAKISQKTFIIFTPIVFTILLFPVGYAIKPIVEIYRKYDLRMSPRGDFKGWKEWGEKTLHALETPKDQTLFIAADFRLASQLLWNMPLSLENVHCIDNRHQYKTWTAPDSRKFLKAIFVGDNRHGLEKERFQTICHHPLEWKESETLLLGKVIKLITESECRDLNHEKYADLMSLSR
jgi:hypothetical protein